MRHLNDLVGNPPVGDIATKRIQQGPVVEGMALLRLDDEDRTLAPFGIGPTDDRNQPHARQSPDDGLNLRRIDPLAARFDQILGAAGDRQIALVVDAGEIARVEITLAVQRVSPAP